MQKNIRRVMARRIQTVKLVIQRVRKPSKRMPVLRLRGGVNAQVNVCQATPACTCKFSVT